MKFLILFILIAFSLCANAQIKHGIVVGVSDSWLKRSDFPGGGYGGGVGEQYGILDGKWKARPSFSFGYQLQFDIKKRFVLDAALQFQSRGVHVFYMPSNIEKVDETKRFNAIALSGVYSYKVWKGVKAGLGLEPTYYWNTNYWDNQKKSTFDAPLIIRAGYDFNFMDVSLSYKQGFNSIVNLVGYTYRAKSRDVQLSVFIPLGKFGL